MHPADLASFKSKVFQKQPIGQLVFIQKRTMKAPCLVVRPKRWEFRVAAIPLHLWALFISEYIDTSINRNTGSSISVVVQPRVTEDPNRAEGVFTLEVNLPISRLSPVSLVYNM
jgi:hypothetical protein